MKNQMQLFRIISLSFVTMHGATAWGQSDTTKLEDLSLKELLNVKINTVSKMQEQLFDAPLSASVITKEQIRKAGSTSIMEALRLVPGMIVREQTNGNYDIHLRGMDNVPPNAAFDVTSNTTTLVMIDNRPVYTYFKGGTFWETLPVDLNDVEKIEVVRGPAAALYGPNAVNGVINIITQQPTKKGAYTLANVRAGSLHTFIANASIGYKAENWNIIASANHQDRNRSQTSYFEFVRDRALDKPDYFAGFTTDTAYNISQRYPHPAVAMNKSAANLFFNYSPQKKISISVSTGFENSEVQKVSVENTFTPLSTTSSNSRYIDLRTRLGKFSAQASFIKGTQNTDFDPGNKFDFNTLDAAAEYNYTVGNFSLKPGVSYRSAKFDDRLYNDWAQKKGIFNMAKEMTTHSVSLRTEYKLFDAKLRLVGAAMLSKFNQPDTSYASYEVAATYKLSSKQLLRVVYAEAPRSSSMFSTYVDQTVAYFPSGYNRFARIGLTGNQNLKLLTAGMFEIGYRSRLSSSLSLDVEAFSINAKNFSTQLNATPSEEIVGSDTITKVSINFTNLPLQLHQQGITVSIVYNKKKLQVNPFITIQKTIAKNYPTTIIIPPGGPLDLDITHTIGNQFMLKSTPSVYGGFKINYTLTSLLNLSMDAYYYSSQSYSHLSNLFLNDGVRGIDHIPGKLIMNATLSYEPVKRLTLSCSGKNLFGNKTREFFRTDEIPAMLLAGVSFEL